MVVNGTGVVASLQEKDLAGKSFVRAIVFEGEFPTELVLNGSIQGLDLRHGDEIRYIGELGHNKQKSPIAKITEPPKRIIRPNPVTCAATVKTWLTPTAAWCETPDFEFLQLFREPQPPTAHLAEKARILITSPVSGVRVALPD